MPHFYALRPDDYKPGDIVQDRLSGDRGVIKATQILSTGVQWAVLVTIFIISKNITETHIIRPGSLQFAIS